MFHSSKIYKGSEMTVNFKKIFLCLCVFVCFSFYIRCIRQQPESGYCFYLHICTRDNPQSWDLQSRFVFKFFGGWSVEKNASGIDESASCKSLASGSGARLALGPSQPVARASTPSVNVEGGGVRRPLRPGTV